MPKLGFVFFCRYYFCSAISARQKFIKTWQIISIYKSMKHFKFLISILILQCNLVLAGELKTFSPPNGMLYTRHNDDFTIQVRTPGSDWEDVFEYSIAVDNDNKQTATFVKFDFSGKVEVKIRMNNGLLQQVNIRPDRFGIKPEIKGNEFRFSLDKPSKLSIEVNGNKMNNIHLVANAIENEVPDSNADHVIYFGPGIHKPDDMPGDVFTIPSNTTVYIHGDAVLQGKILCNKVENVKIIGRGIIDQAVRGIEITNSKNIAIEGITIINPKHYSIFMGESSDISIKNISAFSMGSWTDGIDMMSCSNVSVDDVFLRTSDDCIAVYAHRWNYYGNSKNVTFKNAILWADIAHPINIGLHGNTKTIGDTIENFVFQDIDILEHDEDDRNYQGAMAICSGDFNLVRNIRFENVYIDEIQEGQIFNIRVVNNPKYCSGPGRSIENIVFKNVVYKGALPNKSVIEGYSNDKNVNGITFENFRINDKLVLLKDSANFKIGNYVEKLKLTK